MPSASQPHSPLWCNHWKLICSMGNLEKMSDKKTSKKHYIFLIYLYRRFVWFINMSRKRRVHSHFFFNFFRLFHWLFSAKRCLTFSLPALYLAPCHWSLPPFIYFYFFLPTLLYRRHIILISCIVYTEDSTYIQWNTYILKKMKRSTYPYLQQFLLRY